jgi:hypothetical protein|tara:strand:+ start:1416 stop:1634 length:219 start_codon:yes stop_codon:yes gene_type:complete
MRIIVLRTYENDAWILCNETKKVFSNLNEALKWFNKKYKSNEFIYDEFSGFIYIEKKKNQVEDFLEIYGDEL